MVKETDMNLRCLLGHMWSKWMHKYEHPNEEWEVRYCYRCGKVQQRSID